MAVTGATASGFFKERYGKLEGAVPFWAKMQEMVPFEERARVGEKYRFPVRVRRGHGFTFQSGTTADTAFALAPVKSGQHRSAEVDGSTCVGRESLAYRVVANATKDGPTAFGDLFDDTVEDLYTGGSFYLEAALLYGQSATGFGVFAEAGSSATTATLRLNAKTSAPGLMAQMEGARVDVFAPGFGTKRNANTTNALEITGVDYDAATSELDVSFAGDAADIDAIAVGDVLLPAGWHATTWQVMAGLDAIVSNTGTLFNISAATNPRWKGNLYNVNDAAANFANMTAAAVQVITNCNITEGLDILCSSLTWASLNNNVAAVRRETKDSGSVKFGASEIVYEAGPGGPMRLVPHPMIKQGEFYIGDCNKNLIRGGVTPLTFSLGVEGQNDKFLRELPDNAGFEIRVMWDQFLISPKPRGWVKGYNVVNPRL